MHLIERINYLQEENDKSYKLIQALNYYKNKIEEQEQLKILAKKKRENRKKRAKTELFGKQHFNTTIQQINSNKKINKLIKLGMRLLIFLITSARISELKNITVA